MQNIITDSKSVAAKDVDVTIIRMQHQNCWPFIHRAL